MRKGIALIQILFLTVILLNVILLAYTNHVNNNRKIRNIVENSELRAYEVAKAGAIDTLVFFQRQSTQPVTNFNPTAQDSEDPATGIVRTLDIFSNTSILKARYIVSKIKAQDVSQYYQKPQGTIWLLYSEGQILRNNQVISEKTIGFLIRRIAITIPYESTIIWNRGGNVILQSRTRLISSGNNISTQQGSGNPQVNNQSAILPNTINWVNNYNNTVQFTNIFGMTFEEMKKVADYVVNNSSQFPQSSPNNPFKSKIIVIDSNQNISLSPFYGSGIIISNTNLTIQGSNPINFSGIIYISSNKNLTIQCSGSVSGVIIGEAGSGTLTFNNQSGGDYLVIEYDPVIINQLRQQIGTYRFFSSFFQVK